MHEHRCSHQQSEAEQSAQVIRDCEHKEHKGGVRDERVKARRPRVHACTLLLAPCCANNDVTTSRRRHQLSEPKRQEKRFSPQRCNLWAYLQKLCLPRLPQTFHRHLLASVDVSVPLILLVSRSTPPISIASEHSTVLCDSVFLVDDDSSSPRKKSRQGVNAANLGSSVMTSGLVTDPTRLGKAGSVEGDVVVTGGVDDSVVEQVPVGDAKARTLARRLGEQHHVRAFDRDAFWCSF